MKKFLVKMLATSEKEMIIEARTKESALNKLERKYLDKEEINFSDDDIVNIDITCEPIKNVRRAKFGSIETVEKDEEKCLIKDYLEVLLNVLSNAEKKVDRKGYLTIKINQDDVDSLEELFDRFYDDEDESEE